MSHADDMWGDPVEIQLGCDDEGGGMSQNEVSRMNVYSYMNEGPSLNDEIPWWTIQTIFNTCSPLQGKKPC